MLPFKDIFILLLCSYQLFDAFCIQKYEHEIDERETFFTVFEYLINSTIAHSITLQTEKWMLRLSEGKECIF